MTFMMKFCKLNARIKFNGTFMTFMTFNCLKTKRKNYFLENKNKV